MLLAIKDGEGRGVTRTQQPRGQNPGVWWCPWCNASAQDNRQVCICGAEIKETVPPPYEAPAVLESAPMCQCGHSQHNDHGQCIYRRYCGCEEFELGADI